MLYAALDTSIGCALAVKDDSGIIIDEYLTGTGRDSDRMLANWIKGLLAQRGLTLSDIEGWTVGTGPGSFAGLRCGIAFIKGVCLVSGAKLRGVPTPLALAAMAPRDKNIVGVINDGRCGQVILTRVDQRNFKFPAMIGEPLPLDPIHLLRSEYACDIWLTVQGDKLPELPREISAALLSADSYSAVPLLDVGTAPWPATLEDTEKSTTPLYVRPPVFVQPSPITKVN